MTKQAGAQAQTNIPKWVYQFGGKTADGGAGDRDLLGGKGANLAEMAGIGLPVPPGFTITTDVCSAFYQNGRTLPEELKAQVTDALNVVGELVSCTYGSAQEPFACFCTLGRARVDARHDGYSIKSRAE